MKCRAPLVLIGIAALASIATPGCVRRTMTITTDPPHALVTLNDHEVGHSEVHTDFIWYGDYDVVIRKPGYQTLHTSWNITPPWYQNIPLDFFFEVLWPGHLLDQHARHFVLEPKRETTPEQLIERAQKTRAGALDPRK